VTSKTVTKADSILPIFAQKCSPSLSASNPDTKMHKNVLIHPCTIKHIHIVFSYLLNKGQFGKVFALRIIERPRMGNHD
jgi:hypothetical protein